MCHKLLSHLATFTLVVLLLIIAIVKINQKTRNSDSLVDNSGIGLSQINLDDDFEKVLFLDILNFYNPANVKHNKHRVDSLVNIRKSLLGEKLLHDVNRDAISRNKTWAILGMLFRFSVVYVIVMFVVYYGVETIGVWRFAKFKQHRFGKISSEGGGVHLFVFLVKKFAKASLLILLFSPAYVIAYAMKTEINTDTVVFMIFLAVLTNGLLVTYSYKFYTFLVAESKKGYVNTAIVKNLDVNYQIGKSGGLCWRDILSISKKFDGHVLSHIFKNARSQYLLTIKEQAAFLVTGLVIIEMALNIQGYLNYEMLRQLLYGNHDIVLAIMIGIFTIVKLTEAVVDIVAHSERKKYENN